MHKCEECGFECASIKLMTQHKFRELNELTETQQRKLIRVYGKEWIDHISEVKSVGINKVDN